MLDKELFEEFEEMDLEMESSDTENEINDDSDNELNVDEEVASDDSEENENDKEPGDSIDELAETFAKQEEESKSKKKGGKKNSTTTSKEATTKKTAAEPPKLKILTGYKVVVYGDELFTVDDPKTTEEDIRKTLEETYQYIEFSKNKTVIHVNDENKVITPHVKFQNKG